MNYDPYYHHRKSIRLKGYDYSSDGYYFLTMCSSHRKNLFACLSVGAGLAPAQGDVSNLSNNKVSAANPLDFKLTRIGKIIDTQWNKLPSYFKNVTIDEYVIMPDHFHAIIVIGKDQIINQNLVRDIATIAENINVSGVNSSSLRAPARGAPTIGLGSVIGSFKSRCINENLKYIEENGLNELGKFWQRNYYERIIRTQDELNGIRNYIWENPEKLLMDEGYLTS